MNSPKTNQPAKKVPPKPKANGASPSSKPVSVASWAYNLFWLHPIPSNVQPTPLARRDKNTLDTSPGVPGLILYPAFLTPSVIAGDTRLELLILTKGKDLLRTDINRQLKVSKGLDRLKRYNPAPLFPKLSKDSIRVASIKFDRIMLKTESLFTGNIDERAFKILKDKKYTKLFRVSLDHRCLLNADGASQQFNKWKNKKLVGQTAYDKIIAEELQRMNGPRIPERGKYAFSVKGGDVVPGAAVLAEPLQAYHPVFYHQTLGFADVAHISDIHISSRQQVMAQSPARVIEYTEKGVEKDLNVSPRIGPMINKCSENIKRIMDKVGRGSAKALFVGGDIIDFIPNVSVPQQNTRTIREVWDALDLGSNYRQRYQDFIDFVSFYSLALDFCRGSGKPIFALTGNHDCYNDAYGISPRVLGKRANEGIPADHNLTLYEGILAFGRTYDTLKSRSMFTASQFRWFYAVLTPFADFAVRLPKQVLVGLAWGDEEDLLDVPLTNHGFGHLPRSDDAISDDQLKVVKDAVADKGRKVILSSHFTFASYAEKIPMSTTKEGDIEFDWAANYGDHDMGTFETNRKGLYEDLLGLKRRIQCVITGHSHRRGIYLIRGVDYWGDNSVRTCFFDFSEYPGLKRRLQSPGKRSKTDRYAARPCASSKADALEPAMIVSDSAGPIPRYNWGGEFAGWGSSPPSGTLVRFGSDGKIRSVDTISSGVKPRFVVALDYLDLISEKPILSDFDSKSFKGGDEAKGKVTRYSFPIKIYVRTGLELNIDAIQLYLNNGGWWRIKLNWNASVKSWEVTGRDARVLRMVFKGYRGREMFIALKISTNVKWMSSYYEFSKGGWWTFECELLRMQKTLAILTYFYRINRRFYLQGAQPSEFPHFSSREKMSKYTRRSS